MYHDVSSQWIVTAADRRRVERDTVRSLFSGRSLLILILFPVIVAVIIGARGSVIAGIVGGIVALAATIALIWRRAHFTLSRQYPVGFCATSFCGARTFVLTSAIGRIEVGWAQLMSPRVVGTVVTISQASAPQQRLALPRRLVPDEALRRMQSS